MAKGKLLQDTFEQLVELGSSTAKKTVKSVAQTFNPLSMLSQTDSGRTDSVKERSGKTESVKGKNHTPLDFDKLQNKFQDKDKMKTEALRNRLFQMVKQGDERLVMDQKQKELEKKRREEWEKQEKKKKEEERKRQQSGSIPQGKQRKSIFSHKKVAEQQHAETKPATGKQ